MTTEAEQAKVKLYLSDILRPEFAVELQNQARKYGLIEKAKSKKEWLFGNLVNAEWNNLPLEMRMELSKEQFYFECSHVINSGLPFPIVGESGQTLRRWCNVAESYANMPALEPFKEVLSFDHFFAARWLAGKNKVAAPDLALAMAIEKKWTKDDMIEHYDPKQPIPEYDRTMGWLDSLQSMKFEWVRDAARRKEAVRLLTELRKIVEAR